MLFDSTVLIAHLRGVDAATDLLARAAATHTATCSVLSLFEIESGVRVKEWPQVRALFSVTTVHPVTEPIAAKAAGYARSYRRSNRGIDAVDYLIAATAEVTGADLMTLNVKHFPMIKDLRKAF